MSPKVKSNTINNTQWFIPQIDADFIWVDLSWGFINCFILAKLFTYINVCGTDGWEDG